MVNIENNYLIVEEDYPFLTEEDIRNENYKKLGKIKDGPFSIINPEEFFNSKERKIKAPRVISRISKDLFYQLKLARRYDSLDRIIREIKEKNIPEKYSEEKEKLLYRLILEDTLSTWKKAFGIFPYLYDLGESYLLFSFLTEKLEKRNLFETFSLIANNPGLLHEKLDFNKKQHAYILNEKYRLINLGKDGEGRTAWFPNSLASPYEFNRLVKRILEIENAPKEVFKIVEKQEKILSEERKKLEELELKFVLKG